MRRLRALPWKKIVLFGVPSLLLSFLVLFGVAYALTDIPQPNKLSQAQTTVIRYAGGEEMARLGTNRQLVPLSQMSEPAQKAVLAAEDRGFYSEPGISPKGIARALFTNVRGGGNVQQGGSTITQQYAKNAFLSSERTYTRKVKEVLISLKMTRERSKEQILEDYLNTIYFGRGAYGIQAASKAYFGPDASAATLTAEQGAVLAASVRSPAGYEPAKHPEAARARWDYVLDGMVSQGWLEAGERSAAAYPTVIAPGSGTTGADLTGPVGHVVDAVQEELKARGFDEDVVNAGGLTVTTTLIKADQDAAIRAVEVINKGDKGDKALQGALVSVVPGDGAVRAYYGGANGSGLDYAGGVVPGGSVVRQPGSSMKPYVLATALEKGIPLTKTYDGDSPQRIAGQEISNFDNEQLGQVDLVEATAESVNTVYFQLGIDVGPAAVATTAHAAGIPADVSLVTRSSGQTEGGIALGQYEVHVIDQAAAYATFAAQGNQVAPYIVAKVERAGGTEYEAKPIPRRAFSAEVAADATYAMQQVVQRGTGTRARLAGGRPAAGKTGTTTNNTDVWFAGFTPQLSTAVWFGYGNLDKVTTASGGEATGGSLSSGVWKAYMDVAMKGQPEQDFPPRANVGRRSAPSSAGPSATRRPQTVPPATRPTTAPLTPAPTTEAPTTGPTPSPSRTPRQTTPATSAPPQPSLVPSATGAVGAGTAGLGTAGVGTAGLGTAGLGTAGLGTAGLGTAGLGAGP